MQRERAERHERREPRLHEQLCTVTQVEREVGQPTRIHRVAEQSSGTCNSIHGNPLTERLTIRITVLVHWALYAQCKSDRPTSVFLSSKPEEELGAYTRN